MDEKIFYLGEVVEIEIEKSSDGGLAKWGKMVVVGEISVIAFSCKLQENSPLLLVV